MSDIDVEGSDDEVIVVTESPERQTITDDIDVEAVTDEEVAIANSEEEDNSDDSEINVDENTDNEEDEIDVETVTNQEEDESGNPIQALPIVGELPVGTSTEENVSSRPFSPFLPLPHNLILTPELTTFACTAISAQNITRQSNTSLASSSSIAPTMSANQASVSSTSASVVMETSDTVTSSSSVETPATPSSSTGLNVNAIQMIGQTDSPRDFRSPKRRRIVSPVSGDQEEEGNCCPICFEEWTSSGNHRLASLRCGHLFGQSCIDKWLKGQGGKCPQCNAKAKRQDIRVLYAKCLKVIDTTERDRALQELEKEKEARRRGEMEDAQMRMQHHMAVMENVKMREEITKLREQLQHVRSHSSTVPNVSQSSVSENPTSRTSVGQFVVDKTIKIWDAGNCRVMAYSPSLATLVVSQPSASTLFPGFGIKKISSLDFKTSQYLTIHSKTIRDVSFHPVVDDGVLLSCALDKTVKMTSVISNAVVQTYETPSPSWSCVWNADDRNVFYVGMQNGRVLEFDIRNTVEHVQELNTEGSRSPVASLQYVQKDMNAVFRCGGLLVGQLDKVSFYEKKQDQYKLHILPLEGNLSSQCFEPNTRHLLCSFKPSQKHPTVRHQLCEMNYVNVSPDPTALDMSCSCDIIQTFHAGRTQTLLSKSVVLPHPSMDNNLLVCAGDESTQSLHIWDNGNSQLKQRLRTDGAVLDICAIRTNHTTYLAALTDKILKVFKWC